MTLIAKNFTDVLDELFNVRENIRQIVGASENHDELTEKLAGIIEKFNSNLSSEQVLYYSQLLFMDIACSDKTMENLYCAWCEFVKGGTR